jgi:hypothetical protein
VPFFKVGVTERSEFFVEADTFEQASELAHEALQDEYVSAEIQRSTMGVTTVYRDPWEGVNEDEYYIVYDSGDERPSIR